MPKITNFQGVMSDAETKDLPDGASQDQKNVSTTSPGRLRVRKGIQPATFSSTTEIATGFNTFQRLCFCKTRFGDLIMVNGVDAGKIWDGIAATADTLGITAPTTAPTVAMAEINGIASIADNGSGLYRVTTDNVHGLTTGDSVGIANVTGTSTMATDLNNKRHTVTVATTTAFDVDDSTFAGVHTAGTGHIGPPNQGASVGTYTVGYRYVDDRAQDVYSSLSPTATVVVSTTDEFKKFSWSGITASSESRVENVELYRSTSGQSNVLNRIVSQADTTSTYAADTEDDDTLNAKDPTEPETLLILRDPPGDTTIVARRFTPPPTDRPIVVPFQDRYWYGGGVRYNAGTVATAGSTTITGTGTAWTSQMAGRYIDIDGESAPLLISTASATSITTSTAAGTTASGKSYVIYPDPSNRRKLMFSEPDEPESVPATNVRTIQENTGDDDEISGLMVHGSHLYVLTERHKYALGFAAQPNVDAAVRYVDDRGAFNHFCFDYLDEIAYLMDHQGPYAFDGRTSQPLGSPIQDLWRKDGDGDTIDFSKQNKFFVQSDRPKEKVYFFVAFTGDSGDVPTRALVFNARRSTWDKYEYPQEIGGAAAAQVSNETRMLVGGESATVYLADEGTTDIVTSETTGTVTSATSTSLSDTGASFVAGMVTASVYIYEGTGKGQRRKISAVPTSTSLTVAAWTTTPDTTSKYSIGAIEWNWKSKHFDIHAKERADRRSLGLFYKPTSGDSRVDARFYYNRDSSPETFDHSYNVGEAVQIKEANQTDVVFAIKSTDSSLSDSTGYDEFDFSGQSSGATQADRQVAIELRGHQGTDAIEIQEITIDGVGDE